MMLEHHPLAGREIAIPEAGRLTVRLAPDEARYSLRLDPAQAGEAGRILGLDLPPRIGGLSRSEGATVVKLGPDEWYLLVPPGRREALEAASAALSQTVPHSLVDVSDREVGLEVEGTAALLALQAAIPFDIEAMPLNSGCRTIFDRAQIVLLREDQERFRIEVWRSFATHVWDLLQAVSHEIRHGI